MYDSRVEWEGLGWRNKSTVLTRGEHPGVSWGSGEVQGPTSRELQPVDIGKMKEKETGKGSHEVRGEPRE